ncbi:MAG: ribonuclease HII [Ostreibacterium sp.]
MTPSARIIGVDEAGRGALIGDVVASAVLLPSRYDVSFLADSKTLSEQKREQCADYIKSIAVAYAIGSASALEIDQLNIHHATLLAMKRAIKLIHQQLSGQYEQIWVDGKFTPNIVDLNKPSMAFVKGDVLYSCISAASILAKTHRDAMLRKLHEKHPLYGFATHKGYPTKVHRQAIEQYGVLSGHRRSYKTIQTFLV